MPSLEGLPRRRGARLVFSEEAAGVEFFTELFGFTAESGLEATDRGVGQGNDSQRRRAVFELMEAESIPLSYGLCQSSWWRTS